MTLLVPPDRALTALIVHSLAYELKQDCFKQAVSAGADVLVNAYKGILSATPGAAGKPGGPNFLHAWDAVGKKVAETKDGSGWYAVVGTKRKGGQRLAPQVLFGEKGTKKRKTASGANRGIMPVQHWLETAIAIAGDDAREAMLQKLASCAAKYRK